MPLKNTNNKFLSISSDSIEDDFPIIGIGASFGAASTFTPGNGYQYVVYTGPGVMTVERGGFVDILLVGGGGGGGNFTNVFFPDSTNPYNPTRQGYFGGGGGAGGCLELFSYPLPIGTHQVSIGGGGAASVVVTGSPYVASRGTNGTPSTFSNPAGEFTTLTAYGGGAGGGTDSNGSPLQPGIYGGSGGGTGGPGPEPIGVGNRVTGNPTAIPVLPQQVSPQGNNGVSNDNPLGKGGGGGGWGGAGGENTDIPSPQILTSGGIGGRVWSGDTGLPTNYGTPGPDTGRYFGGGGGSGPAPINYGGAGGGGGGTLFDTSNPYTAYPIPADDSNGKANTGGGGGSGSSRIGSGGSGVFIMRFKV